MIDQPDFVRKRAVYCLRLHKGISPVEALAALVTIPRVGLCDTSWLHNLRVYYLLIY